MLHHYRLCAFTVLRPAIAVPSDLYSTSQNPFALSAAAQTQTEIASVLKGAHTVCALQIYCLELVIALKKSPCLKPMWCFVFVVFSTLWYASPISALEE